MKAEMNRVVRAKREERHELKLVGSLKKVFIDASGMEVGSSPSTPFPIY